MYKINFSKYHVKIKFGLRNGIMQKYLKFEIFKSIGNGRFTQLVFSKICSVYFLLLLISNLKRFNRTTVVFVNSYAFGHSVTETSIFFDLYKKDGLCISLGNKSNRNYYLKYFYQNNNLLHFRTPLIRDINIYHAIRKRMHIELEKFLKGNKLATLIRKGDHKVVTRDELLEVAAMQNLMEIYKHSRISANDQISSFNSYYETAYGKKASSALHYLVQQRSPIHLYMHPRIISLNKKFLKSAMNFAEIKSQKNLKICTLVLRKSWKPWSGSGFDIYMDSVKFLSDKGYLVNIVGDLQEFNEINKRLLPKNVKTHRDYKSNMKLFQILSIINSDFCIGDQSGIQALIHFFNKKNLIINNIPFGQHTYNSVVLPRTWVRENGQSITLEEYLQDALYRIHSYKNQSGELIEPRVHKTHHILESVKLFVESIEHYGEISGVIPSSLLNETDKSMLKYCNNSYYSPVFFGVI